MNKKQLEIINELQEIAECEENSLGEKTFTISNRRAFAKTEVFQMLRKKELTNETLYLIINNFNMSALGVTEFFSKHLGEIDLIKFVDIGGVELAAKEKGKYFISQNEVPKRLYNCLLENVKIKQPIQELSYFFDFMLRGKTQGLNDCSENFIRIFSNEVVQKKFLNTENEFAVLKNYGKWLNLMEYTEEKSVFSINEINEENINRVLSSLANASAEEISKVIRFATTIEKMPFIEYNTIVELLEADKDLTDLSRAILLIITASNEYLKDNTSIFDIFLKINLLTQKYELSNCYKKQMLGVCNNFSSFRNSPIVNRVIKDSSANKKTKQLAYRSWFSALEDDRNGSIEPVLINLKLAVECEMNDERIIKLLEEYFEIFSRMEYSVEIFRLDPYCKHTYPSERVFKFLFEEWKCLKVETRLIPSESVGSDEDKNLLFQKFSSSFEPAFVTWSMANSKKYLRKMLEKGNNTFYHHRFLESFNIKNIGSKNCLTIVQDIKRSLKEEREIFKRGSIIIHLLQIATTEELDAYSNILPFNTLQNCERVGIKTLEKILKKTKLEESEDSIMDRNTMLLQNLSVNTVLTAEEKIELLSKIGYNYALSAFTRSEKISDVRDIRLRVKDFEDMSIEMFSEEFKNRRRC